MLKYIRTKEVDAKMGITIWVVRCCTNDGELRSYECYLFKWIAKKRFEELTKYFPEYRWSYGGDKLYLF